MALLDLLGQRWVLRILQETTSEGEYEFLPASNGRFVNNLIYFSRANLSTYVNVGGDTDAASFEFSHNLWFAHDAPEQSQPNPLPVAESDGIYGQDPDFADASVDDVSISAQSPAAGAGSAVAEVSADLNGNCYEDPPSMGALEVE